MKQVCHLDTYLPRLIGTKISVEMKPQLSVSRGQLLSSEERGTPVYAASFIRRRCIVLDSALLATPRLLRAILVHELSHFVWVRLSNLSRNQFSLLIQQEHGSKARGEVGESASVHKLALSSSWASGHARLWRNYICESFCDTSAAVFVPDAPRPRPHLSLRWLRIRCEWLRQQSRDGWRL